MSSTITGARLESSWEASSVTADSFSASDSAFTSWGSASFGGVTGSRELWDGDTKPEASPARNEGERDGEGEGNSQSPLSDWEISSELTTCLAGPKSTAKELRRAKGRDGAGGRGGAGSFVENLGGVPFKSAPPVDTHRFLGEGESSAGGRGEQDRLGGVPIGLPRPCIRFPYNSPRFLAGAFSGNWEPPMPKLPRGTGTPPFSSNLAILSRKPPVPLPGMFFAAN